MYGKKDAIKEYVTSHREEMLRFLMDLVNLEGRYDEKSKVEQVRAFYQTALEKEGFLCKVIEVAEDRAGILVAELGADRPGKPIILEGHLDTVHRAGSFGTTDPCRVEGDKVYGPGVLDMKGGMTSVSGTVAMVILAFGLFGILNTAGVLDKVVEPLAKRIKTYVGGAVCTLIFGLIANLSSSTTFAYLFTSNMLSGVYDKHGFDRKELANAVMVGSLPLGLWIPWNTNAATPAASLGIEAGAVAPLLVVPYVYIVVLIVSAFIKQKKQKAQK